MRNDGGRWVESRRVLMTADTVGGVWTYAIELSRELSERGVDVVLATMGGLPSLAQQREAAAIPRLELESRSFKLEWMDRAWDDVGMAGEWLLELEREYEPGIIHLNGYAHGTRPFRAPKIVVGHSCVLSWFDAVERRAAPAEWERYRRVVRSGLLAADMVVAPSRAMFAALGRHYGELPRARVIANGVRPVVRRDLPKEPIIFSAGRLWDPAKNIELLERVAGEVSWPVFCAGDTVSPDGRAADVRKIHLLGALPRPNVLEWMARSWIYVLPARYEPFGLSALEAASSGCALVLGDIASLREIWEDDAIFVPPDDPDALREAVEDLIHNAQKRCALAGRAKERAERTTGARMGGAYLELYRELRSSRLEGPGR